MPNHNVNVAPIPQSSGDEEWRNPHWPAVDKAVAKMHHGKGHASAHPHPAHANSNSTSAQSHSILPKDNITGQRPVVYNITIKEIIGQKISTQKVYGTQADTKLVGEELAKILQKVASTMTNHPGH